MDLLEILNKILITKNEIRDILGENNNIARYSISIHNLLAKSYNEAYRQGFHDRWHTLTGDDRYVSGTQELLDYNINYAHYDKFTTEILTDIMRDVLNYRLIMKDEMNAYLEPDIADNFQEYPEYLKGLILHIAEIGVNDGVSGADEAYDATAEVDIPTISYNANRFVLSSEQDNAALYFKLGENGIVTLYTGPVIISESCTIYYYAKIGLSQTETQTYDATITSGGNSAFVFPPSIYQEDGRIYLSTTTNGASIQYSIDDGDWATYYGPLFVSSQMQTIKAMCVRNNEYSNYNTADIEHEVYDDSLRPANVRCTFTKISGGATVTLTCATENARIFYAIDEADGFYREYSATFNEMSTRFLIYVYSVKDGYYSKMKLVYKYDEQEDVTVPADVQFIEEGSTVTMYTTTSGAKIHYRLDSIGSFIETNKNAVSVTLDSQTDISAYSELNGITSRNLSTYRYYPNGSTTAGKPAKPVIHQDGNVVTISSNYEVRYTLDQTDPRAYGITYNEKLGITITEYTVVKAAAYKDGVFSDVATKSCSFDNTSTGGGSGSDPGSGYNPGSGVDTDEQFVADNWFAVTGITGLNFNGQLYYATSSSRVWKTVGGQSITGLDMNVTYYFKGSVSNISSFTGSATISGDVASIKGNSLNTPDLDYRGLFRNCQNLVNASGLIINITNMPGAMMQDMFNGCTSLREAAFTISTDTVASYGMNRMFYGCTSLIGGPTFSFSVVKDFGLASAFQDCVSLSTANSLSLTTAGQNAFNSCYRNCRELTEFRMDTPTGIAASNVFASMFEGCTGLRMIDRINMKYDTMGSSSCARMFYGCTSLNTSFALNASILADSCYQSMFEGCTNLGSAPSISAVQLATNCCNSMFAGCTSLYASPVLDVENISGATGCYSNMFSGCTRLGYVTAMFKNDPRSGAYTANWLRNVSPTGIFYANKEAAWPNQVERSATTIPEGWNILNAATVGKITDIWSQDGYCYISTASNDSIWYNTGTAPITDTQYLTTEYTQPFKLDAETYVSAACKNSDGVFGSIYSELINPGYPNLIIHQRSGNVWIDTGVEFTYDSIQYQICEFESDTVVKDWTMYNSSTGFSIDQDRRIKAKGFVNGTEVVTAVADLYYDTTSPVIEFLITFNGDHTAVLKRWCNISYPNTDNLVSLWYKINDSNDDNPDTAPSAWTRYSSAFEVTQYIDSTHEMVSVTAIAKVRHNGTEVWSSTNKAEMHRDSSEQLHDPAFIQLSGTNNVVLEYAGEQYTSWNNPDVVVEYRIELGGLWKSYTQTINLQDLNLLSEQDAAM